MVSFCWSQKVILQIPAQHLECERFQEMFWACKQAALHTDHVHQISSNGTKANIENRSACRAVRRSGALAHAEAFTLVHPKDRMQFLIILDHNDLFVLRVLKIFLLHKALKSLK
jgi:hypothetical protein